MALFIVLIASVLILGQTRSGKTTGLLYPILRSVGQVAKVIIDPQKSLSRMALAHLSFRGMAKYVRFIRLSDWKRSFGFLDLKPSESTNALRRRQENHDRVMGIAQILMNRRDITPLTSVLIFEWLYAGLKLVMHSHCPLYWLPYAFRPKSPQYFQMLHQCDDAETREKIIQIYYFSDVQRRKDSDPTHRLCEFMAYDLAFVLLCGGLNLADLLARNLVLIFEGHGANHETARTALIAVISKVLQAVERYSIPVELYVDEWNSWNLLTPDFGVAIASLQKQGLRPFLSGQNLKGDEDTIKSVLENCRANWFYRIGDMETVRIAASKIATSTLDPTKVLRTESRSTGLDSQLVDIYETYSDQEKSAAQKVMQLPTGAFFHCCNGQVQLFHPPKLWEPWSCWDGLAELKMNRAIEQILSSPEYTTPNLKEPQTFTKAEMQRILGISGSNGHKQKQAAPKSGKKGMRKSSRGRKRTR